MKTTINIDRIGNLERPFFGECIGGTILNWQIYRRLLKISEFAPPYGLEKVLFEIIWSANSVRLTSYS